MESSAVNHRMITRSKLIEEPNKPVILKDSTKRSADHLPDVGNKKRILGDITNQPLVSNIKSNLTTRKSSKSSKHDNENSALCINIENNSVSKSNISEKGSKKVSDKISGSEKVISEKEPISENVSIIDEPASEDESMVVEEPSSDDELMIEEDPASEDESIVEPDSKYESIEETVSEKVSSKSSKISEDSVYCTALEDSIVEISSVEVKPKRVKEQIPEGVEDFDEASQKDPFSESRYATDIFMYYLEREKLFPVKKYLNRQKDMNKGMRSILVDWMVEVQESFELNHETLYLAVKLVDQYLMKHYVSKSQLQLVGATAICIAAKYDERQPPLVDDFLYICDDSYTREQLIQTEIKMLQTVDFDLGIPLSYRFLRRYARCARMSMELLTLARYILETSLMDYEIIDVLDSKIAAASLLLAIKMKKQEWTPTHEYYTGFKESDLKDIVYSLNKMIAAPLNNHLQTIRTKYSHQVFFEVSKIPPLNLCK